MTIVDAFIKNRAQPNSIFYTMELRHKSFSMEDTVLRVAKVELRRDPLDSLFGGLLSIDVMDTLWFGYDGQNIYRASMDDSTLTTGEAIKHPGLYIKSTWVDNFIDYGFLKNSPGPRSLIEDQTIDKVYSDTIIEGRPCLGILFKLPDEEGFTDQRLFAAIDTADYMVRSRMYSVHFQENEQYTNWLYKNVSYGDDTTLIGRMNDYVSGFRQIELYNPDTITAQKQPEYDFQRLSGKMFKTGALVKLSDCKANFIILDFWYASCYPCIKSIPLVNRLYRDYKDKGVVVFGVNMIDDEEIGKVRLEKFFRNNPMEYTPLMINSDLTEQIDIPTYPTLIVLDSHFQIIYMEEGYSEDLYDKVAALLNSKL